METGSNASHAIVCCYHDASKCCVCVCVCRTRGPAALAEVGQCVLPALHLPTIPILSHIPELFMLHATTIFHVVCLKNGEVRMCHKGMCVRACMSSLAIWRYTGRRSGTTDSD